MSKRKVVAMRIRSFHDGQRVKVLRNEKGIAVGAVGTVKRLRRNDNGAWVELDRRHKNEAVHPFPKGDDRARHVLAYPEDCEMPMQTGRDRRRSKRAELTPSAPSIKEFGCDHWSTLLYVEARCTDNSGIPDRRNMRCLDGRHPQYSHGHDSSEHPTRLADDKLLPNHDDWDCVDDLERAGLVVIGGTGINPVWQMTEEGQRIVGLLRMHKQRGHGTATFRMDPDAHEAVGT